MANATLPTNHFSRLSPELQKMWKDVIKSTSKHDKFDGNEADKEFNEAVHRVAPHLKHEEDRKRREDFAENDETRQQIIEDKIAEVNRLNKNTQEFQNKFGHLGGRREKCSYKKRSCKKRSCNKRSYKKRSCKRRKCKK
jgi:hypothetical protein